MAAKGTWDPESHRLLRERLALAAEAESAEARARQWAGATDGERGRALAELMDFAETVIRSRGRPASRPPLNYPRLKGRPSRLLR